MVLRQGEEEGRLEPDSDQHRELRGSLGGRPSPGHREVQERDTEEDWTLIIGRDGGNGSGGDSDLVAVVPATVGQEEGLGPGLLQVGQHLAVDGHHSDRDCQDNGDTNCHHDGDGSGDFQEYIIRRRRC